MTHAVLAGFLLLALLAPGALPAQPPAAPAAPEANVPELDRARMDALLARPGELVVVDVRRAEEIAAKGGFPVFLSVQLGDLERASPFLPRDRTVVTVSNHAARAKKAAALLTASGFRVAGAIGVDGYAAAGGTLVGQAAAPQPASRP